MTNAAYGRLKDMDLGLDGKIALVAAASKGLGKAAAWGLAAEGARVAICAREEATLRAAATDIAGATGSEVLPVVADLTSAANIQRLVEHTVAHYGGLHILVTNAGGPPSGYFADFSDEDWLKAVNLTLMSAVRLIRAALPHMVKARWGRIVNITSMSVKQPIDDLILSNAIRTAIVGLAKTLSRQVAADGITVNNVCPSYILTGRIHQLAEARAREQGISTEEVVASYIEDVPVGRIGQPEEVAALIVFLASERASYINGATIQVDGGKYRGLM
jgi:3-oxoacyl-[acyl-carrier protein] reductase